MNLYSLREQIRKRGKTDEIKKWNSFIDNLKQEFKKRIKHYKKMLVLDKKAYENKKKKVVRYNNFLINKNWEQDPNYWILIDYLKIGNKTYRDNYKYNELKRQEYKITLLETTLDGIYRIMGNNETKIEIFFNKLKI